MQAPQEIKIVFAGPMGAGKTTAIRAISSVPAVSTEVANTDRQRSTKETTTVALDYGQLNLDDGTVVRLYGTPGQERFSFMWEILSKGALGIILLIDASSATAATDLSTYAHQFHHCSGGAPLVIGVGRLPVDSRRQLDEYAKALGVHERATPIFSVDVRKREDVLLLIDTSLCLLEARDAGPQREAS
jgi:small GTP-binding protein